MKKAEEAFHRLVNTDCSSYHARLRMLEAQSNIKKINEAKHADGEKISKDDEPQLMGEAKTAMNNITDVNIKSFSDLSLESRVAKLYADQQHTFDVQSHLLHQQQHEEMSLQ